ncbi:MAG TPA: VOC family protein [Bacillus bacterium]|nr:VOC family protein [Bacillus sp. (in: firmicutes)]
MQINKILTRVYVNNAEKAIEFYEGLFQKKISSRFKMQNPDLEVINIDNLLIIVGTEEELASVRNTMATFSVDSLQEYKEVLLNSGATIIKDIKKVPTGWNMTVKHKDGIVVEYVQRNVD